MSAEAYAQGLREWAEWVEAHADVIDAEGLDLRLSESYPIVTPSVWARLRPGLDGNDDTVHGSGSVVVSRQFGPIDVRLYAAESVDEAARELTAEVRP